MKSLHFIWGVLLTLLLMSVMYFLIVDQYLIYEKGVQVSYKPELLKSLSEHEGKVIVIGGSDAHYGVNAQILEGLLKRPVINAGLNANVPYKQHIYNAKKYLKKGDIVIAMITWPYFFNENYLSGDYVEALVDEKVSNQYFYKNLPFVEKVKFVFTLLPYQSVNQKVFSRPSEIAKVRSQLAFADGFYVLVTEETEGLRGSAGKDIDVDQVPSEVDRDTCDQYMIGNSASGPLNKAPISDAAIESLDLLKSLEKQGVTVLFSWGVVVNRGDTGKCYETNVSKNLDLFAGRIREAVSDRGIPILGDYRDYLFPKKCFLNTYAHINRACAGEMAEKLFKNGLHKYVSHKEFDSNVITEVARDHIRNIKDVYENKYVLLLSPLPSNQVILADEIEKYVYFGDGWSGVEHWGVWTDDRVSKFRLKKNITSKGGSLYINGVYFNGEEKTKVIINKEEVGSFILRAKTIALPESIIDAKILTIELHHTLLASPQSLDPESTDDREIKFGLKEIGLIGAD